MLPTVSAIESRIAIRRLEQADVVQAEHDEAQPQQRRRDDPALDDIADEGVEQQHDRQGEGRLHQPAPAEQAATDVDRNPEQRRRQQRHDEPGSTAALRSRVEARRRPSRGPVRAGR